MAEKVAIEDDWLIINGNDAIHLATIVQVKWYTSTDYHQQNNPNEWQYIKIVSEHGHVEANIYYTETQKSLLKADMRKVRMAAQKVRRVHVGRVGKGSW